MKISVFTRFFSVVALTLGVSAVSFAAPTKNGGREEFREKGKAEREVEAREFQARAVRSAEVRQSNESYKLQNSLEKLAIEMESYAEKDVKAGVDAKALRNLISLLGSADAPPQAATILREYSRLVAETIPTEEDFIRPAVLEMILMGTHGSVKWTADSLNGFADTLKVAADFGSSGQRMKTQEAWKKAVEQRGLAKEFEEKCKNYGSALGI